ncbi:MAG: glutamyl-tRNA reductase [Verrucomicrobiales bacterium]|nr:glutamyl-tRNA reductase [Verrucomicrobiales bacterium]
MSLLCLGVNYKTAPVEIRERLAFPETGLPDRLREITGLDPVREAVVLSTCNRVEIYAAAEDHAEAFERLTHYLVDHFRLDSPAAIEFYRLEDDGAARHLFHVASGLDSMVLGETEIFGQVKKAYQIACDASVTARCLNKLFQQSFRIGKLVRSGTQIQQGSTSVGSVAVDVAEQIFGRLDGCRVMVVGAGEMSRQVAQSLLSRGASSIIVSNRSHDKAVELAAELNGEAVRFDDWERVLAEVDIVISSTSAPHAIIHPAMIETVMPHRFGRSLFLIDIAVPRDIEPAVNDIDNVYLYDIDFLEKIAARARIEREKQIALCEAMIERHIGEKGIEALSPERRPETGASQPTDRINSMGNIQKRNPV